VWLEWSATILIALAALLTAWAAFQSAKWNGVQADESRLASIAGTTASKQTTIASAQRNVDVLTFLQWLEAVRDDIDAGLVDPAAAPYVPDPRTLSGFIAVRFRTEFKPAFDAWIAARPLVNSNAPGTPFEVPQYALAADAEVERLTSEAGDRARHAQEANNRAEDYVLVTVLFAIALVFASVGSKVSQIVAGTFAVAVAFTLTLLAALAMATFPIQI
jgi:hypothetical protein